jgi:tRNA (cmo5U34)-methyltransferase
MSSFDDAHSTVRYAENTIRRVPGYADLQRMTMVLLAERAPNDGAILVLGAGGGSELRLFADSMPDWRLVGVDPSASMLRLAKDTLGEHGERVQLHQGYISDVPAGPFDGAACLLTLHFLERPERLRTLQGLRSRLKQGAPLVVAHHSYPRDEVARDLWLSRFVAYGISMGVDPSAAGATKTALAAKLPALPPEEDEALLREAGFSDVALFYAALTFRGWVAYA